MTRLRGLAWDHVRCWGPLEASIASYRKMHPDFDIRWDRQSLYDFGEGRLEHVVDDYDVILIDHPFTGQIAAQRLMVPFDKVLDQKRLKEFASESVGKSWGSYSRDHSQWALPVDAGCQVSSYRPDLMERYGSLPENNDQVVRLAARLRIDGKAIGLPLVPTEALSLILSFCAQRTHNELWGILDRHAVEDAVNELSALSALVHPKSWDWSPIRCYNYMTTRDDVIYVPYAFAYVNYSVMDGPRHLRFANIPTPNHAGSLLGGTGIAVSAASPNQAAAMDYAIYLASGGYQRGEYFDAGGQPAARSAWLDERVNAASRNFFQNTIATMEGAYLRPTENRFLDLFRELAPAALRAVRGQIRPADFANLIERMHGKLFHKRRLAQV